MQSELAAGRALGAFPLSIATSLAIESACGVYPDRPVYPAPILDYPELWINIRTLFRNLLGSLESHAAAAIFPDTACDAITNEMDQIATIIKEASGGRTKVVFYYSNYLHTNNKHKGVFEHQIGVVRMDNTDKQKHYSLIHNKTMQLLLKTHHGDIKVFDLKLKPDTVMPKALILTHYAYDLVSSKLFSELVLLESHTGHLKKRAQWYTKYLNGKELAMIPFREDLIQVFGDSETYHPADIRLRRELIEIATKYHWSAVTTHAKIAYGIDQMRNHYYRDALKSILVM